MEHPAGRGGPVGYPRGRPYPRLMPIAVGDKYRGMADGAVVNGKWDGTGCAVMGRFSLPVIWPRYIRPPQILRWLKRRLICLPFPQLQEGHPCHGASQ